MTEREQPDKHEQEQPSLQNGEGLPTSEAGQDDLTQLYYPTDEELARINQAAETLQSEEEQGAGDVVIYEPVPDEPDIPPPTDG